MSDTLSFNVSENVGTKDGLVGRATLTEEQRLAFQDYLKAFRVHATIHSYEPFVVQLTDEALIRK